MLLEYLPRISLDIKSQNILVSMDEKGNFDQGLYRSIARYRAPLFHNSSQDSSLPQLQPTVWCLVVVSIYTFLYKSVILKIHFFSSWTLMSWIGLGKCDFLGTVVSYGDVWNTVFSAGEVYSETSLCDSVSCLQFGDRYWNYNVCVFFLSKFSFS